MGKSLRKQSGLSFKLARYIDEETLNELINRATNLSRKIAGFISYLKKSTYKGQKYNKKT